MSEANAPETSIDFFVKYSNTPENTPFWAELKKICPSARIFGGVVRFHFDSRIKIVTEGYPRLICYAIRSAMRSMVLSAKRPSVAVVQSDVEVIVFSLVKALLGRKSPRVVFSTFIYTERRSPIYRWVRHFYYNLIVLMCDTLICHSRIEVRNYGDQFARCADKFTFVLWGGYFVGSEDVSLQKGDASWEGRPFRVFSIGRSGRDYRTFVAAITGEDVEATIACDQQEMLQDIGEASNLRVLRECYGDTYLDELRRCDAVVIPLAATAASISAGQMVLVGAMAFAKPLIITRTVTTGDYVQDGVNGLLVDGGSPGALREAIQRLRQDRELYERLQRGARSSYQTNHSEAAYLRNVVNVIRSAAASDT